MSKSRQAVLEALVRESRRSQNATHIVDSVTGKLLGISQSEGMCLDVLDREGPQTPGQLAALTQLTTGAITAVVDRLEEKGYARRVRDDGDRRRVLVEITEKARRRADDLYGELGRRGRELLGAFTVAELELITRFLRVSSELNEEHAARLRERHEL